MVEKICPVITIDGPGGTGKGTVTHLLAQELGWNYLDSGVLYRVLALAANQHQVAFSNQEALTLLAGHLDVQFETKEFGMPARVILESADVTDIIRSEDIGSAASQIAVIPSVRAGLLERQRAFREFPGLVTDGRDMGTVVFPDAQLKIYLDAGAEERAKRRLKQLQHKDIQADYDTILQEILIRDRRDAERTVAPMQGAPDAIHIDTTHLSVQDVTRQILERARVIFNLDKEAAH